MRTAPDTLTIERLRLAAALTHLVPRAVLSVWPDAGPAWRVSTDAAATPDLSACHFRRAVAAMAGSGTPAPGRSWMSAVEQLAIDGRGLRHVGDGVVAEDLSPRWWWATALPAASIPGVLHEEAVATLERGRVGQEVVAATTISVHVDELLGVNVVAADLAATGPGGTPAADAFVRQLSRGCLVAELLHKDRLGRRDVSE